MCRVETPEPIKLFGVTVQFEFSFKDYNEIIQEVDNTKVNIPDDLLITLMSVSYSTTRGILSMFTDGTDYQDVLLPLVNIQEFKAMLLPQQV